MSPSVDLQTVIFEVLIADAAVAGLVQGRVYDNVPSAPPPYPYISFGPSDYELSRPDGMRMRTETFQIDGWVSESGKKRPARVLCDAIARALDEHEADMGDSALVRMRVTSVRVLDDPSGIRAHGVVTIEAPIEES